MEYATLEWVDLFNNCRSLEPIGNIPPAQAEENFLAALESDMAAQLGSALDRPGAVQRVALAVLNDVQLLARLAICRCSILNYNLKLTCDKPS